MYSVAILTLPEGKEVVYGREERVDKYCNKVIKSGSKDKNGGYGTQFKSETFSGAELVAKQYSIQNEIDKVTPV